MKKAHQTKLKNRRVIVHKDEEDDSFYILFRKLIEKREIKETEIALSFEAAINLAATIMRICNIQQEKAQKLIDSLGHTLPDNKYIVKPDNKGEWWIEHEGVGSSEPLEQWLNSVNY